MKKNKKAIIISSSILVGILILFYVVAVIIYNVSFNYRCTSDEALICKMEDFDNLERKRYEFETKKGNNLVGYLYSNEIIEEKGLVVFAHGLGGGGQRGYLDIFDYLSSNGYYVFAYDATANDESEGKVIGGLPQGIIDLDYAINFTKTIEEVKDLPLMLMGYSWGGLSVSNVLNYHDEVKAVVAISGWNKSLNLIEYHGCQMVGPLGKILLPFASIYEHIKYGIGVGYGAYYSTADMPIPMVADCADYETYRSGKFIPGIMGTLFSLVDKLVSSLSATVVSIALLFIGTTLIPFTILSR